MGKSILVGSSSVTTATNTTQYWMISGSNYGSTTEANHKVPIRSAGVLSKIAVYISASNTNGDSVLRLRKNGANGNLSITIPAGTTGWFEDTVHTDSVTAGDVFCYQTVPSSSGTLTIRCITITFTPTDGSITDSRLILTEPTSYNASTVFYNVLNGINTVILTSVTNARYKPGIAGDFKYWAAYSSAGGRAWNERFIKNGNDDLTARLALNADVTGLIENISDTISIINTDDINHLTVYGGSGSTRTIEWIALSFLSDEKKSIWMSGRSNSQVQNFNTTGNYSIAGELITTTSAEANAQTKIKDDYRITQLRVRVTANSINAGNSILSFRKNGVDGNLTVTIPAGSTGVFEDITHSDDITVDDLVNWQIVSSGSSGTVSLSYIAAIAEDITSAGEPVECTVTSKTVTNKFITIAA